MAQKHKSKYKTPKDFEKSQKPKPRKDLKDYTEDDKKGALNPRSTGDKQLNVLRKTDKAVQDDGKMFPKYNDDDRLYKDIEDGDYDPKTAAKRLKKRQDTEEKEVKDVLKDKIENLTREQKERLVREYVRRKIQKVLFEQPDPNAPAPEEEPAAPETPPADAAAAAPETPPTDAAAPSPETPPADAAAAAPETPPADAATPTPTDATATPPADLAMDMGAMPTGGGAPAPSAPAPTDAAAPTPDATATPPADASATPPADASAAAPTAPSPEEETDKLIQKASERLSKEGAIGKIKLINKILKNAMQEVDIEDKGNFYKMLRSFAIKKIATLSTESEPQETEEQQPQS